MRRQRRWAMRRVSSLASRKIETGNCAASAVQDCVRQPLRRRSPPASSSTSRLSSGGPAPRADGLPLAVREPVRGSGLFVPEEEIRERTFAEARHYGALAGVRYAEAVCAEGSRARRRSDPDSRAVSLNRFTSDQGVICHLDLPHATVLQWPAGEGIQILHEESKA